MEIYRKELDLQYLKKLITLVTLLKLIDNKVTYPWVIKELFQLYIS